MTTTEAAREALKPCPFCGGNASIYDEDSAGQRQVTCNSCGASSPLDRNPAFTIDAWNRRAALPPPEAGQEPVAWRWFDPDVGEMLSTSTKKLAEEAAATGITIHSLYAADTIQALQAEVERLKAELTECRGVLGGTNG